jgi:ABC-2 type transport system permease protein/lipopolysaccharide transport system permease protein
MPTESLAVPAVCEPPPKPSLASFLRRNVSEMYRFRFALASFVANTLRKRYHRSALGFFWSLLVPLAMMGSMAFMFSLVFEAPFKTFAMYIFSGMAPWGFICASTQSGAQSLLLGEPFLKRVYVPKPLFPFITTTTELVNFIFTMASLYVLAMLFGIFPGVNVIFLPLAIAILYVFCLGLAMACAVATVYSRDLTHIINVVTSILTYALPIIYRMDQVPVKYHFIFYVNPFFYIIDMFRKIMLGAALAPMDLITPLIIALVAFGVGVLAVKAKENDLVFRL